MFAKVFRTQKCLAILSGFIESVCFRFPECLFDESMVKTKIAIRRFYTVGYCVVRSILRVGG